MLRKSPFLIIGKRCYARSPLKLLNYGYGIQKIHVLPSAGLLGGTWIEVGVHAIDGHGLFYEMFLHDP